MWPGKFQLFSKVIFEDMVMFDEAKVADELLKVFKHACNENTRALLLECTNMPPYKPNLNNSKILRSLIFCPQLKRYYRTR